MKRFIKYITAFVVVLVGLVTFSSCSDKYNFYNDWTQAGAELTEDNIIEVLTIDEIKEKREAKDTFVLFVGTSQSYNARIKMGLFDQYTQDLGVTKDVLTVYYFNTTDYYSLNSNRNLVKQTTGIKDQLHSTSDALYVCIYKDGELKVDTTNTDAVEMESFINGSQVDYDALFTYILQSFPENLK